jgi:hypothetical protein
MSEPNLGPSPAQITIMGHNITARITARRTQRRRNARLALAGGALLVGVTLTAAVYAVASAPRDAQAGTFSCYSADDLGSDFSAVAFGDHAVTDAARVAAALEACEISYGLDGVIAAQPTACELPDLRLAVFPNVETVDDVAAFCTALGLGTPPE